MDETTHVGLGWGVVLASAIFGTLSIGLGVFFFAIAFFAVTAGGIAWLIYCFVIYQGPNIPEYLAYWKREATQWLP